ncbi:putative ribosome biogenesis GTPase RsgA 2 [Skermanella aerolata]|uniref:Small ribosomal subunit biogenesis GTPase RsgA n=1 Tax=Skermanella aerolata TaxID=393310 RepID=A0A512DYJ6_9PROT|nr:putative ribosome biogenesis GTPase RsgA 2 [Skermanella aerolata]
MAGDGGEATIPSYLRDARSEEEYPTVGDWLLIDRDTHRLDRVLHRASLFKRRAPGTGRKPQLIAANIDTLFIVSSCNQDFNVARLERYLILAGEAGVTPIVVLTKADLTDEPEAYAKAARALRRGLLVETVNALDPGDIAAIKAWCGPGQTVALMGSSGVGKSTLINTLTGAPALATQSIRDDDRGRHTTTARSLHRLEEGGWLIDTPGMRELQLTDTAAGVDEVFEDITALAKSCRFSDCAHGTEPGCAVRAAVDAGTLTPERLARWRKLAAEEAFNTETLAERRTRTRAFGKMVRSVLKEKDRMKRS